MLKDFSAIGFLNGNQVLPNRGIGFRTNKFDGKKLDELRVNHIINSKDECKMVIDFLTIHQHCFDEDVTPYIEPKEDNCNQTLDAAAKDGYYGLRTPLNFDSGISIKPKEEGKAKENKLETDFKDYMTSYLKKDGFAIEEFKAFKNQYNWQKEQTKALQERHDKLLEAAIKVADYMGESGGGYKAYNNLMDEIENAKNYAKK
jgi:hypothetical protein